ncbi:aryl-alcohol dehydrogenase-like predicted oxidoreductase [Mucilaginibacter gracilis]|uniref:Aryl-alcohol dehydrogenase-like predicted oxidoreductase n=1 Tax=Mucilaginibacter gracilis TaxID=423350 RepID=A0A495J4N4_9SPHI|nr:aldo/keto reductase [Mucilaginibacter gracilis]RKR83935.1 aryl-alcohol dehydrogenase-like predicted oxidoreductase [Mucilaginibacter gracilis]
MDKVKLGTTGIDVSPLCFGGNVFGWTIDEATSFKILDAATNAGINFIDTADVYSTWAHGGEGGQSETIIGKWLKQSGKRDNVIIATKVGKEMGPDKKGLSRAYITQAVEDSLKRLQTDYIDLYQSHDDDTHTPLRETLEVYTDLIKQGKVRAIGASNYSATRLTEALHVSKEHNLATYQTLQPLYNLYDRADFEAEFKDVCLENDIAVINFYALASGFLTGKYRTEADLATTKRASNKKYLNNRGLKILNAIDQVAAQYRANPAQVSIAWLLAQPAVTAPIASATSIEQLADLVKATNLKLDTEAIALLTEASN